MAEAHCAQKFRGHLASIHSSQVNEQLRRMAKSGTNQAQVWVGGITASSGGRPYCKWEDGTPWDYNNWASGSRSRNGKTCVALCTAGGHWRSVSCQTHLPFICGY
ncbi:proteoglycan 3-like [Carettochelys insculpta]|uniref:proteoglycan 3-like n=1 Tax=Carettochelys insculpta TaxID=44489 RepID=UPI003EBC1BA5